MPSGKITPSLHRYFATTSGKWALRKIAARYTATSLQPLENGLRKKYPLATSLLRHNLRKMASEKNARSLHRYFATTFGKWPPKKIQSPKNCFLNKNIPTLHCYFATSLQPSEKWTLKKIPHRYIATSLQSPKKFSLNKITPRYISTSLQPSEKWTLSLPKKRPPKKITPSLHCHFATTSGK